jgi:membrane-bound lytic murein transglycosylase B
MSVPRPVAVATTWLAVLGAAAGLTLAALSALREPAPILQYDAARLAAGVPSASGSSTTGAGRPSVVDPVWLRHTVAATGLPATAVRAYAVATLRMIDERPGCHLGWSTLAGVAEVESVHGTLGGRTLLADGRPSQPIIGPALDGNGPVAAIRAGSTATALHGDPTWDHAVGPFQFLPSSWSRWGGDGDGDGVADPQDLDDAALGAARYLCAGDGDLRNGAAWQDAVFSYNHAASYVAAVYAAALRFSRP